MIFGGIPEPEVEEAPHPEAIKVEKWRCFCLLEAGYDLEAAIAIAKRPDVDLRKAVGLLENGCELETALLILL